MAFAEGLNNSILFPALLKYFEDKRAMEERMNRFNQFGQATTETVYKPQGETVYGQPQSLNLQYPLPEGMKVQYPTTLPTVQPTQQGVPLDSPQFLNAAMQFLGGGGGQQDLNTLIQLRQLGQGQFKEIPAGTTYGVLSGGRFTPQGTTEFKPMTQTPPYQFGSPVPTESGLQIPVGNKRTGQAQLIPTNQQVQPKPQPVQSNIVPVVGEDGTITYQVIQTPKAGGQPSVKETGAKVPPRVGGAGGNARLQQEAAQLTALESNLKQYAQGLTKVQGGRIGGTISKIGAAVEQNPNARAVQGLENTLTGLIARAISREVGVITEGDVQRAKSMLPLITDNQEERQLKFNQIYKAIADRKAALQGMGGGAVKINSDEEYDKLPSGTEFIAPDGTHRRKP